MRDKLFDIVTIIAMAMAALLLATLLFAVIYSVVTGDYTILATRVRIVD